MGIMGIFLVMGNVGFVSSAVGIRGLGALFKHIGSVVRVLGFRFSKGPKNEVLYIWESIWLLCTWTLGVRV